MQRRATGPGAQIRSENGIARAMEIVGAMIGEAPNESKGVGRMRQSLPRRAAV